MPESVLVPVADGTEEMEAVIIIDVLRRAEIHVDVVSVTDQLEITASRGVRIKADKRISDLNEPHFSAIVIPGGMPGAQHIVDSKRFMNFLRQHIRSNRLVGAICAAPVIVLTRSGLFPDTPMTCHPSFQKELTNPLHSRESVVSAAKLVTAQGPGTAFLFALTIAELLTNTETRNAVAGPMGLQ